MIISFRHKGLKRLYEKNDRSGIRPDMADRIQEMLTLLDAIGEVQGMNVPGYKLHKLTGDLKGIWSTTVRANWRIIFRFENGHAYDVELIDYH